MVEAKGRSRSRLPTEKKEENGVRRSVNKLRTDCNHVTCNANIIVVDQRPVAHPFLTSHQVSGFGGPVTDAFLTSNQSVVHFVGARQCSLATR